MEWLQPIQNLLGSAWLPIWTVVKIMLIVAPLMGAVAYLTLAERKVIGWMQIRISQSCGLFRSVATAGGRLEVVYEGNYRAFRLE